LQERTGKKSNREWNWTFSWGVSHSEKINTKSDNGYMGLRCFGYPTYKQLVIHGLESLIGSTYKANPVIKRKMAIKGKVVSSKLRRPKVSIVQMAGNANTKFTAPKPNEANNVCIDEKLASAKISDYKCSSCQIVAERRKR